MVVEKSNSIQVRQQCLGCKYPKFELTISIFVGCVLIFPRVSNFWPIYYWHDREGNGAFTGMCGALWKTYQ